MSAPHLPPVGPATASDVYTQSQETTVSTLTAFTSIVDSSVVGEEEDPELPPLMSIFHCSMIEETSTNSQNGKICWLCASGVEKRSRQGINHGHFVTC